MTETDTAIRHVVIRGLVQGVGYRAWTERAALAHGLEGWVRNRRDGSVEAVFAGAPDKVAGLIEACRQGPRGARVDAVDQWDAASPALSPRRAGERFSLLPTI
ncbi:MAG: acylphosphatase [Rhizobiales bacterium]|nr:acylphosphatase [Hyphomicrobiales bacterium]